MKVKRKKYGPGSPISKEFEIWHRAILEHAHAAIAARGWKIDDPTKRVIMKRVRKLEELIAFFYRDEGYPFHREAPFLADDAAALVLWPRWKAERLARKLLPKIPRDMVGEWFRGINMDWFDYELEV